MVPRLKKARTAFKKKDRAASKKAHGKKAIEEPHTESGSYVGDFVYGGIDGSVTTFAVVSGVAGASLSANIVVILGVANLFADGVSMAVSNYLGAKSNIEYIEKEREREKWEIKNYPEGEVEEVRQIYKKKGFSGKDLDKAVKIITSNKKIWVDTMMKDELKLIEERASPINKGIVTFIAFVLIGAIPLISYVLSYFSEAIKEVAYPISIILTGFAFFFVGSAKTYITGGNFFKHGFKTLFMGGAAASIAYGIGFALRGLA